MDSELAIEILVCVSFVVAVGWMRVRESQIDREMRKRARLLEKHGEPFDLEVTYEDGKTYRYMSEPWRVRKGDIVHPYPPVKVWEARLENLRQLVASGKATFEEYQRYEHMRKSPEQREREWRDKWEPRSA